MRLFVRNDLSIKLILHIIHRLIFEFVDRHKYDIHEKLRTMKMMKSFIHMSRRLVYIGTARETHAAVGHMNKTQIGNTRSWFRPIPLVKLLVCETPSEVWPYGWGWFLEILRRPSFFLCSSAGQGTGVGNHLFKDFIPSFTIKQQILILLCNYMSHDWFSSMVLLHSTFKGIVLIKMKMFIPKAALKYIPLCTSAWPKYTTYCLSISTCHCFTLH